MTAKEARDLTEQNIPEYVEVTLKDCREKINNAAREGDDSCTVPYSLHWKVKEILRADGFNIEYCNGDYFISW